MNESPTSAPGQLILLDTLYPPAPDQLVADCRAVGAGGCWVYAARYDAAGADLGIGGWTAAHVAALHDDGRVAPAIIVPGSTPGEGGPMLDAADGLGCDRPTAFDLEQFSLPSAAWLAAAIAAARARGRLPLRYGDQGVLAGYPAADGDWLSHGQIVVRAGGYLPVPELPAGLAADQYAVEVSIGSTVYDVSVADAAVFGGEMNEQEHGWLSDITTWVDQVAAPNLAAIMAARPGEDQWRQQVTEQLAALGAPNIAQLEQQLTDLQAQLGRIEKALQGLAAA